ncbi:hypothetical protein OsJ_36702 [Oryza sativa Japonica Group]|uniref:RNase H type-1 domain-containing protein n=1 Tax=Oryza sativa subsp. japonica TaxID=39947 RepID=A3CIZ5_ORYSJ|nr:hypothetical protein OsJ_36702 [Oryza sativa Japonica Group]
MPWSSWRYSKNSSSKKPTKSPGALDGLSADTRPPVLAELLLSLVLGKTCHKALAEAPTVSLLTARHVSWVEAFQTLRHRSSSIMRDMSTRRALSRRNTVQSGRSVRKGNTWKAPPLGILKINFDGAYREMSRDGASCFVIRGENGQGVLAGSGRLPMVSDALMAEAEACLAAHEAAIDHGISQVIIESDCLNLVSALKSDEFDRSARGIVFRELRLLLSMYFIVTDIRHVRRSCNACADALAQVCIWTRNIK